MGFEICGILVLWEKGGEEGRNRERKVGQEPWSINLRALGIDMVRKPEDQKRIIAELRKKFRKTLVEVFEGGGRNILDISWVTLWKELETLESSFFYLQHLKLLKIQAASQPSSRGDGGGKGKKQGECGGEGKGAGASTSFTFVVSLNKRQIVDHDQ